MLVNSDLAALHGLLRGDTSIETSATSSLSSPTTSLCAERSFNNLETSRDVIATPHVIATPRDVIDHVADNYLLLHGEDSSGSVGEWSGSQACDSSVIVVDKVPEISTNSEHERFEWIFGKTPKFIKTFYSRDSEVVSVTVEKGLIADVSGGEHEHRELLLRKEYHPENIARILQAINTSGDDEFFS